MSEGFYDDPTVYDILHASGTAMEARGVEAVARKHHPRRRRFVFLEPGCGTARHLRKLAALGHHAIGFDLSQTMIDDANTRAARAGVARSCDLFVADMTGFADRVRTPVHAVFNLINTVRHLPDDRAMLRHFEHTARVLAPGGVYVVGISTTVPDIEQPSEDVWAGARGRCRVTQTVNYLPPGPGSRTETVISHLHIRRPRGDEHRDSTYTLRTYTLDEWASLIDRSALRIDRVCDEAGDDVDPPAMGYAWYCLTAR